MGRHRRLQDGDTFVTWLIGVLRRGMTCRTPPRDPDVPAYGMTCVKVVDARSAAVPTLTPM
jgi:hypothetical protein